MTGQSTDTPAMSASDLADARRFLERVLDRCFAMSSEYVEVLSLKRYGEVRDNLTVREFFLALARLGGHQNRKCDGHPGWLVLWRGWMKLQAMLDGYHAAQRKRCGKT